MGPAADWAVPRRMFALMDVFQGAKLSHKRPAYGIDQVRCGNALVAVREEIVLDMPFGNLLHFAKDEVETAQPRILLVAPMSGHFSTLLRGTVETLLLLTPANPLLDAPADLKIADALAKAKTVIHHGTRTDATALAATWHVPASHYLESWSDARTVNGVYSVVQPMIPPLYDDCASELEILSALLTDDGKLVTGEGEAGAPSPAYDAVKKTFEAIGGKGSLKKVFR